MVQQLLQAVCISAFDSIRTAIMVCLACPAAVAFQTLPFRAHFGCITNQWCSPEIFLRVCINAGVPIMRTRERTPLRLELVHEEITSWSLLLLLSIDAPYICDFFPGMGKCTK